MKAAGFINVPLVDHRFDVYRELSKRVSSNNLVYLEYGVWQGDSMREWLRLIDSPEAAFFGFDSFEGLPEEWNTKNPTGRFSTNGRTPKIEDSRVSFVEGWFDDTVPRFEVPSHGQLIINIDADLYSSTRVVFQALEPEIAVGTLIYFDEFCDRNHELKAFAELIEGTGWSFEAVAATRDLAHVGFERVL